MTHSCTRKKNCIPEGEVFCDKEAMPFPKASKSTPALNRAMMNTLNAHHQNKQAAARMWSISPRCPLFLKKSGVKKAKGKKRALRANKALNTHTLKALASGAAANAAVLAQQEALLFRCDVVGEERKYPILPSMSKAVCGLLESAFCAYMSEAFGIAVDLKDVTCRHKKVTQKCASAAIDALNERIANATSFVPAVVVPRIPLPAKSVKKAKTATDETAEAAPVVEAAA
jgi:hypothetical protein